MSDDDMMDLERDDYDEVEPRHNQRRGLDKSRSRATSGGYLSTSTSRLARSTIPTIQPSATIPSDKRGLRACLLCSIIQKERDFKRMGCPNCDEILQLKGSSERVEECTSSRFEGVIAMTDPEKSWVAKWQRIDKFLKGIYAIKVIGVLPAGVIDEIEEAGVHYRRRDGTELD